MAFDWLARVAALTPENLTIREQARLAENPLSLRWQAIFPRIEAPSIRISEIQGVDFRPNGGRRDWNADGQELPERFGPAREWEMVPINPTKHLNERYMQLLRERAGRVDELIRAGIMRDVDGYASYLTDAVYRQIEADAFDAWFLNQIVVLDPKRDETVTVSMQIAADRYVVEPTAWSTPGVAWARMVYHLRQARRKIGSVGAVRTRQAVIDAIVADAPVSATGYAMTTAEAETRLGQEVGSGQGTVRLVADERTYHKLGGAGTTSAETPYVPDGMIGFQPANGIVGRTHFAPVTRAYDYVSGAAVVRGVANDVVVMYHDENNGKTLLLEAQANAQSMPDQDTTYVVDTGL